jgi:hypothetical protein
VQLDQATHFIQQTFVRRDDPIAVHHREADKLYAVIERQQWKKDLVNLKDALAQDEKMLANFEEDFNRIEADSAIKWKAKGKSGDPRLTPQEETQREQCKTNAKRCRSEIENKKDLVAKLEKKLAETTVAD